MTEHMTRREFAKRAAAIAAAAPALVRGAAPKSAGGLNVLFIMTDEQHWRSLSIAGNPHIATPNMDRLAREGALFENATCVTPYCSPSRASIITGVYPHTHGILYNVSLRAKRQKPLLHDAFPNTECLLNDRGYATFHRGKWHLGDTGEFPCYESRGYAAKSPREYNEFLEAHLPRAQFAGDKDPGRYLGLPVKKIPAIREGWRKFHEIPNNRVAYIATIGRTVIPPEWLPETLIADQAVELIEQNAGRNFMITVSWVPPHDLWVASEPYYSLVDRGKIELPGTTDLPPWDRKGASKLLGDIVGPEGIREYAAIYHGMVKYIDDQLGRILKKLDDLKLAERTLVIFTTDHGDMAGAHGCIGKTVSGFYDDLVRIPLVMRLPGAIKPGTVVRQPVSQIDLMPTILDYTGNPIPPHVHGRSMRPLIEGRETPWRDHAFCQRGDRGRMLRADGWKYAFCHQPRMVSLYDLHNDPHEDRNLAADAAHGKRARDMHARLLEIMKADGDPLAAAFPRQPEA